MTEAEKAEYGKVLQEQIAAVYGDNAINTSCYYIRNLDLQNAVRGLGANHTIFMLIIMVAWIGLNTKEGQTEEGFGHFVDMELLAIKSMYPDLKVLFDRALKEQADAHLAMAPAAGSA